MKTKRYSLIDLFIMTALAAVINTALLHLGWL